MRNCWGCKKPIDDNEFNWYNYLITEFSEEYPLGRPMLTKNLCEVCFKGMVANRSEEIEEIKKNEL